MREIDESLDGIEHINIYSKGKTLLGRKLSNFAFSPFNHPVYGPFNSIEGFWFFLKCYLSHGDSHEELRSLDGYLAKKRGTELLGETTENVSLRKEFQEEIILAIKLKLKQNRDILNLLVDSSLPLEHYYVFKGKTNFAKDLPEYRWIVDAIEEIRTVSQQFLKDKNLKKF